MWKLILKNIWSRRKQNGWLLAELVVVTVVTWVIIDPVVVLWHDTSLPMGYDIDRICKVELASKLPMAKDYDRTASDADAQALLIDKMRMHPSVAIACPLGNKYLSSRGYSSGSLQMDTTLFRVSFVDFYPHTDFFRAYGIKPIEGSPNAMELDSLTYDSNDIIITRSLAEAFFPEGQAVGKTFFNAWEGRDTTFIRIRGVVEDVRLRPTYRAASVVFTPSTYRPSRGNNVHVLLRLKPDISMQAFLNDFQSYMEKELRAGNWSAISATPYETMISNQEYTSGATNTIRLNVALAVFFLVNLCLGVIGTFWLQTRKRSEEAGIMRSFGATPRHVLLMLLGEGTVLTVISVLTGCFLYLQYAMNEGLFQGYGLEKVPEAMISHWVTGFGTHFIGVSGIVLAIILLVVLVGIYIPGRNISRVNPVDALRDE